MTSTTPRLRLSTVAALFAGTILVAGCGSDPATKTTTTTTEQSTTTTPPPIVSSTTTTTVHQTQP
jgi:hypothetical protein